MGEYAKRKKDGVEVKLGTCESMYYCRFDQVKDTNYKCYDNLFWRIPFPEEDGTQVGDYNFRLFTGDNIPCELMLLKENMDADFKETLTNEQHSGTLFLEDKVTRVRVKVPCYHGLKHPEGRSDYLICSLYLCFLKNTPTELNVGFKCASCERMYSVPFNYIEPLIFDVGMKLRLLHICTEYYIERNGGKVPPYSAEHTLSNGNVLTLAPVENKYELCINNADGELLYVSAGDWRKVCIEFIDHLELPDDIKDYYIAKHA